VRYERPGEPVARRDADVNQRNGGEVPAGVLNGNAIGNPQDAICRFRMPNRNLFRGPQDAEDGRQDCALNGTRDAGSNDLMLGINRSSAGSTNDPGRASNYQILSVTKGNE
jgi:hypothetical protein